MKIIRLGFAILSLACIAYGATNETFEITSYFPGTGEVGIKSGAGRTNRTFSSFTAVEQEQITDWRTDQEFESFGLSVEIEENKTRTRSDRSTDWGEQTKGTTETISYEVTVVNSTDVVLNNIQIDCRTFFLQDITQSQSETTSGGDKRCRIDQFTLSIAPGETRKFKISGVSIRNLKTDRGEFLGTRYTKDDLEGFLVSVSRKDINGKTHRKTYEKGSPPNEKDRPKYTRQ